MFNILLRVFIGVSLSLMIIPDILHAAGFPPSFKCPKNKKSLTTEEKMICAGKGRLGLLDFLIHNKYEFLLKNLSETEANRLKEEQVQWLSQRKLDGIKESFKGKIILTQDENYLEKYLEMRHAQLTDKVMDLTKMDLSSVDKMTEIADKKMAQKLLGDRKFDLQWLSLEAPAGKASITNKNGLYLLKGEKVDRFGYYVKIDGWVSRIDQRYFIFIGEIVTKTSPTEEPCIRKGRFTFTITQGRPYWRLQEMLNPCNGQIDYVDIYFARADK